jgi:ribosomal protein S26
MTTTRRRRRREEKQSTGCATHLTRREVRISAALEAGLAREEANDGRRLRDLQAAEVQVRQLAEHLRGSHTVAAEHDVSTAHHQSQRCVSCAVVAYRVRPAEHNTASTPTHEKHWGEKEQAGKGAEALRPRQQHWTGRLAEHPLHDTRSAAARGEGSVAGCRNNRANTKNKTVMLRHH